MCIVLAAKGSSKCSVLKNLSISVNTTRYEPINLSVTINHHSWFEFKVEGLTLSSVDSHHIIVTSRGMDMSLTLARPLEVHVSLIAMIELFDSSFQLLGMGPCSVESY